VCYPIFWSTSTIWITNHTFASVVDQFKILFHSISGSTSVAFHNILTRDSAIWVAPQRVPAHFCNEVQRQIDHMLKQGVIEDSSSPRMALMPKKSGELRICTDYRELNKQSIIDSCPLPFPDEVYREKLHFVQAQEWVSTSSVACLLVCLVSLEPFNDWYYVDFHLCWRILMIYWSIL